MQNHNEFLKQVETYLEDLPVMEKLKILNEINVDISDKDTIDLMSPLETANAKRNEHGFVRYEKEKKFSLMGFLFKFFAFSTVIVVIGISILVYKFTPILKIDEEKNRVIILGGLIDIDGKAGKVKVLDEYHFSDEKFNNDFKANIDLGQEKDELIMKFDSGNIQIQTSETSEVIIDCKLSKQPTDNIILHEQDLVRVDLTKISGSNCNLKIPLEKKVSLEGKHGNVFLNQPEFDAYIDIKNGKVSILPENEIDYKYQLNISNGYKGEFESSEAENAYEIQVNVDNGSIISQ